MRCLSLEVTSGGDTPVAKPRRLGLVRGGLSGEVGVACQETKVTTVGEGQGLT